MKNRGAGYFSFETIDGNEYTVLPHQVDPYEKHGAFYVFTDVRISEETYNNIKMIKNQNLIIT